MTLTAASPVNIGSSHFVRLGKMLSVGLKIRWEQWLFRLSIVLLVLMNGIILSGNVSPAAAEMLSRLWIAGLIPIFVGLALIVNGVFVSKKLAEVVRRAAQPALPTEPALQPDTNPLEPRPPDTTRITPSSYSVTENTTKHLGIDGQNR